MSLTQTFPNSEAVNSLFIILEDTFNVCRESVVFLNLLFKTGLSSKSFIRRATAATP